MTFYPYLSPLFSIYLILMSYFLEGYAKSLMPDLVKRNLALDWETRVGSINAMVSSLISLYSIFETSKSYGLLTGTSVALICVFVPTLFWIISNKPGQLASQRMRLFKISRRAACLIILCVVNLLLIGAIWANQQHTPTDPPVHVASSAAKGGPVTHR
jgi:hypothetical protein